MEMTALWSSEGEERELTGLLGTVIMKHGVATLALHAGT